MNEKILAGIGGGLILISFLIVISFVVFEGVEDKVVIENGTPGFTQLSQIRDEAKNQLENNTVIEEFREVVGNVTTDVKQKISVGINATLSEKD